MRRGLHPDKKVFIGTWGWWMKQLGDMAGFDNQEV